MLQPEPPTEPAADLRTARVVLVALVVLWAALVFWVLRHGDRLIGASAEAVREVSDAIPATGDARPGETSVSGRGSGPSSANGPDTSVATDATDAGASRDRITANGGGSSDTAVLGAATPEAASPDATASAVDRSDGASRDPGSTVGSDSTDADGGSEPADSNGTLAPRRPSGPAAPVDDSRSSVDDADTDTDEGADKGPDTVVPDDDAAESVFEVRRREEIATLSTLLGKLRFERLGDVPRASSREPLERAFEILFLYPGTRVQLIVAGRETNDAAFDRQLALERGRAVVDYLVSRGIERERLSSDVGEGSGLPFGEHRVRVIVEDENE